MLFFELFIYLGIVLIFFLSTKLHSGLKNLTGIQKTALFLFISLFIAGQVIKSSKLTYPFTKWSMYSQQMPIQSYSEYLFETDDGTVLHYPFDQITFTSQRAFIRKLENAQKNNSSSEEQEQFHHTLTSLVYLYEQKYPEQSIQTFTVNRVHISLTGGQPTYTTTRIPLIELKLHE